MYLLCKLPPTGASKFKIQARDGSDFHLLVNEIINEEEINTKLVEVGGTLPIKKMYSKSLIGQRSLDAEGIFAGLNCYGGLGPNKVRVYIELGEDGCI